MVPCHFFGHPNQQDPVVALGEMGMGGHRQEASVDVPMAEAVGAAGCFKGAAGGSEEDPSTPTREAGPKRPGVSQGWGP